MKGRIKKIRKSNGMNQTEFGAKIGVKQSTVASYEAGSVPPDTVIKAICREFNVTEEWLRTGEGEMYQKSAADAIREIVQSHGLNERDYELIRWFASQDDQTRKTIIDAINAIIGTAKGVHGKEQIPAPVRNVHDMTPDEIRAEVDRQLEEEAADREKGTGESSTGSQNESDAAIA